jgi:glycosyltransferase involved in cell wall biosynthesis
VIPDVSLIMPAWRPRPDWLLAAVSSALEEHDCDVELIVVDDGSPEPVAPLLADLGDQRLRVIRIEHAGPYAARNAGMAAARGAFLRFVDADDIVQPSSTGRLLRLAGGGEEATAYGATLICDEALAPGEVFSSELEGLVAEECVLGRFEVYVVSCLFPRPAVDRAGPWEESFRVSGDWDFVLRVLEQAPVRRLDEVVTLYRRHGASVTLTADVAAGAAAGRLVLDRYFRRNPGHAGSSLERRAYFRLHMDRARAHAWVGEHRHAALEFARAARRDPARALAAGGRWGAGRLAGLSAQAARRARRVLPTGGGNARPD